MGSSPGLLSLPAELQLQIATHLVGNGKRESDKNRLTSTLSDLALTCEQLAPVAREALCSAPVLQSSKVHHLLYFLSRYPNLTNKITQLTVETKETHKDNALPVPIARLDPIVLRHCERHVRTLRMPKHEQDTTIAALKSACFEDHSVLLSVLLSMLPHLSRLYLGGSILANFPLLHGLISIPQADSSVQTLDWARRGAQQSWLLALLGSRLTALELPIDLRRSRGDHIWTPLALSDIPTSFPALRWLSIPHTSVTQNKTTCNDILPANLETLILTDARCDCSKDFLHGLINEETGRSPFPCLSRINLYYRYPCAGMKESTISRLANAGIRIDEYHPRCCLRSGDEFFHPWKYTSAEIGALEESRHVGYESDED